MLRETAVHLNIFQPEVSTLGFRYSGFRDPRVEGSGLSPLRGYAPPQNCPIRRKPSFPSVNPRSTLLKPPLNPSLNPPEATLHPIILQPKFSKPDFESRLSGSETSNFRVRRP